MIDIRTIVFGFVCSLLVVYLLSNHIEVDLSLGLSALSDFTTFIDNFISVFSALALISVIWVMVNYRIRQDRRIDKHNMIVSIAGATACFCIIAFIYFVYQKYSAIHQPWKLFFFSWALPLLTPLLLLIFTKLTTAKIWAAQGVLAIVYIISLDSSYHLTGHKNPIARIEQNVYHWNMLRQSRQNYDRSPLSYLNEIKSLASVIAPNSRFFADKYTSYYVKSILPLYAVNVKSHHRNNTKFAISDKMAELFCKPSITDDKYAALFEQLINIGTQFIIINQDNNNAWLGTDCMIRNQRRLLQYLMAQDYHEIYKGQILTAYAL